MFSLAAKPAVQPIVEIGPARRASGFRALPQNTLLPFNSRACLKIGRWIGYFEAKPRRRLKYSRIPKGCPRWLVPWGHYNSGWHPPRWYYLQRLCKVWRRLTSRND
jgi:hypothetical protein